jgi:hypothetical protein
MAKQRKLEQQDHGEGKRDPAAGNMPSMDDGRWNSGGACAGRRYVPNSIPAEKLP